MGIDASKDLNSLITKTVQTLASRRGYSPIIPRGNDVWKQHMCAKQISECD